jgi:hypothetical protein
MTAMTEQLLPCPFCGGASTTDAYDRGINIGCGSCGYSRHFPGLLQTVPNDKPIAQYRNGAGGITEIPASEATEFYHADAHERAADAWNRRTTIQPVAVPEPVGEVVASDLGYRIQWRGAWPQVGMKLYTAAPAQAAPYEPTLEMLDAARQRDPAMTFEQLRLIWWAMWKAMPTQAVTDAALEDFEARLADACVWCEVPDSTYEALCVALRTTSTYSQKGEGDAQ